MKIGRTFLLILIFLSPNAQGAPPQTPNKKAAAKPLPSNILAAEYHFSLGQAYASDGNTDRAIEEYRLTIMYDPNAALVYGRLAAEYVKKGLLAEALKACKEALERNPKDSDIRLILAGLYSISHQTQAALDEYNRILKEEPKNEEALIFKSQVLVEENRNSEATQGLQRFLKANPESALALVALGKLYQMDNKVDRAIASYKKAIALKPTLNQASLSLGLLYEEKQMPRKAIPVYEQYYGVSQDPIAAARLAALYLKANQFKESLTYLRNLESADPDDLNVRVKLGLVYMELKNFDEAINIFKKILEKVPDSDRVHYYLGNIYEETKQPILAIEELKKIPPDSRLYPDAMLHATYLVKTNTGMSEAKDLIHQSILKSPRYPAFYLFSASLEEETKNIPIAIDILEKALNEFPGDEKIRYYLGTLYDRTGDNGKSLAQMEAILQTNPSNVDALNYIGYTWTEKGIRMNDAERLLKKALGLRPENGYIQDSWGWHLLRKGKVKEAVVELEKAAKLKPNEPTILEHLGDAYLRANLREKALIQYNDAIKFFLDGTSKKKVQNKVENLRLEMISNGIIQGPEK